MKALLSTIAALVVAALPGVASAQTLDKIKSTGSITLGIRDASIPLSYTPDGSQPVGFHIDICQRIVAAAQKQLDLPKINVQYQMVTSQNRIPLVQNGTVDLECGSTTNNVTRQRSVSFALTTYVEEVRMAVKKSSNIHSVADLTGKTVVTTTGTTSVQHLRRHVLAKGLDIMDVLAKDHSESFLLLEQDRADAWVLDAGLMSATIANAKNPGDFAVVGEILNVEPIAIMLRKDDPAFKAVADSTIRELIRSGEMKTLWKKWFQGPIPPKGVRLNMGAPETLQRLWAEPNDLPMESFANK
ncbi:MULTISPECIES: amino acid ABC transporter substrate-binding protein [Comamonadaceae]|uniref:Amino acid ABC transporter substrate-binding protein n=1 Tax=Alicycliphilus denitrificans TaxID=179636 RepID=A0A858ZUM7_9BURK|nr:MULTISPECIES: amino acid ABC transporter substrate-binding protein [Comamonadaceae]QKD44636.1 amino acid ABC transporter substrate-binding protein [Alicycliphilus denitrificans]